MFLLISFWEVKGVLLNIYYNKEAIASVTVETTELVQLLHETGVKGTGPRGTPPGLTPSFLVFLGRGERTFLRAYCMLGIVQAVMGEGMVSLGPFSKEGSVLRKSGRPAQ